MKQHWNFSYNLSPYTVFYKGEGNGRTKNKTTQPSQHAYLKK